MKKCFYCGKEINDEDVMGFCDACGIKIWGPKMLATIKEGYGKAKDNDDLVHMDTAATLKVLRGSTQSSNIRDQQRERRIA